MTKNIAIQDTTGPHGQEVSVSLYPEAALVAELRRLPGAMTNEPVPLDHLPPEVEKSLREAIERVLDDRLPEHRWPEVNTCVILRDATNKPEGVQVTVRYG